MIPDSICAPLLASAVRSRDQVLDLAAIRNQGRLSFAHDQHDITPQEQLTWWLRLDQDIARFWLYYLPGSFRPVGFLGLWRKAGAILSTMGVAAAYRGRGYARLINMHAIMVCPDDVHTEVLVSNIAMIKSFAATAGYELIEESGGSVWYVGRRASLMQALGLDQP